MKTFLSIACAFLLLLSCGKKEEENNIHPFDFSINGFPAEQTVMQTDTLTIPFLIDYIAGEKKQVALMIHGLPSFMTAGFDTSVGLPPYPTSLRLITQGTDTGTYLLKLTASTGKIEKQADLRLRIVPNPANPANVLIGNYLETGSCNHSGNLGDSVVVQTVSGPFNQIEFHGLWSGNPLTHVKGQVDPAAQTITIPPQEIAGAMYWGDGTYTNSQIQLSYRVVAGSTVDSCESLLNRF